ncbi:MAG: NAD-dependent epimerase/dehydratase family protein [Bacteroidota bacterium]|nr:NAD-dependent epimerase/dehydratase family protein [Bacteroidota bacterium]
MNNNKYKIGISCIGSGVGQSVINSLRLSRLPITTIGLGTNPFAYGAYDCDEYDYTLSVYDNNYIDNLIDKCLEHQIDLVIPGLDDEAMVFAQNIRKFEEAGIKAIVASEELISICRNKERMSNELNKVIPVFAKSFDRDNMIENIENNNLRFPFIAKPRSGFASRGIEIIRCKDDLSKISENHIIQELIVPIKTDPNYDYYMSEIAKYRNPQVSEVSIQVVYTPEGHLLGRMFSFNKLNNGVPIEIVPYENEYIWSIIDKLTPTLLAMGLRGPLNIQGRITEDGLKLFEMNSRFTGITYLRALMGFNEVEACVKEWLGIDKGNNQLQFNYNRFGVRQTADKSIPVERNKEVLNLVRRLNGAEIKKKKTVLITGACGYLGQNLISKLSADDNFELWAFDPDKQMAKSLFETKVDAIYDLADWDQGRVPLGNADVLVHMGFVHPDETCKQISECLKFTHELFTRALMNQVPAIINVSSKSIYGLESNPYAADEKTVNSFTAYDQAVYATELLLTSLGRVNNVLKYSSLRLGVLSGGAKGLVEVDSFSTIVKSALEGKPIGIIDGMHKIDCLDIRDAIDAIILMLKKNPVNWRTGYDLSSGNSLDLMSIAQKSVQIASRFNGDILSEIVVQGNKVPMETSMDCSLFCEDMSWQPKYGIEDMIESLIVHFQNGHEKKEVKRTAGHL